MRDYTNICISIIEDKVYMHSNCKDDLELASILFELSRDILNELENKNED